MLPDFASMFSQVRNSLWLRVVRGSEVNDTLTILSQSPMKRIYFRCKQSAHTRTSAFAGFIFFQLLFSWESRS